jgi:hypothetical protein
MKEAPGASLELARKVLRTEAQAILGLVDRIDGDFKFAGPSVTAAGYQARNVRASGTFADGRINLDAGAAAYGGSATAKGFIALPAAGRRLAFDLRGRADSVDLRDLPAQTRAPNLATNLAVEEYHVAGQGSSITGNVVLNQSTVEGATIADGTVAEFKTGPDGISYAARGNVEGLDVQRIGNVMGIAALDKPAYTGALNGGFDVKGTVPV